ncbi:MAG: PspC domain-containing protein [Chloroflexota bacterium]|nr:PspC domain-containing protein [Chloroflexota bacterium]
MTTEQPTAPRLLRRRTDDRVVGGVASGLGDFLNVDPLLVRIGFVGLMVFGGLGLLLYVAGWLLVPEESSDDSIVGELITRMALPPVPWLILLLFGVGGLLFIGGLGYSIAFPELAVVLGIVLLVVGGALFGRTGRSFSIAAPPVATTTAPRVEARPAVARRPRPRRVRSPLGWYVLGAMLACIGLLALATNVSGADVDLGQFFGVALAVIGIGLVTGTWWGHARLLILLGLLLLPLAITASFITAPIEGGLGYHRFSPTTAQELHDEYRLVGGRMELDLTAVERTAEPIRIAASVAAGQLYLALPEGAGIELISEVGAGELGVLGTWQYGTGLSDRYVADGSGPRFILDLEMGIGSIWVDGFSSGDR